jgi:hypothetical protein
LAGVAHLRRFEILDQRRVVDPQRGEALLARSELLQFLDALPGKDGLQSVRIHRSVDDLFAERHVFHLARPEQGLEVAVGEVARGTDQVFLDRDDGQQRDQEVPQRKLVFLFHRTKRKSLFLPQLDPGQTALPRGSSGDAGQTRTGFPNRWR